MSEQTTEQTPSVTIRPVTTEDGLFAVFGREQAPQPCFIALDLRDGAMWAAYNPEIGNAVPVAVWHGIVLRWRIPLVRGSSANALMEQIRPNAERIMVDSEIAWDSSNQVGRLGDDARDADDDIAELLNEEEPDLYWYDAAEWLHEAEHEIGAALTAGTSLGELHDRYNGSGLSEDEPILVGLMPYLERLADEQRLAATE